MPVHDWTRVEDGIYHHFHHRWISEISDTLNEGLLPQDYYALAEHFASGFGPDVLTLQGPFGKGDDADEGSPGSGGLLVAPPKVQLTGETDMEFYRRKSKVVAIRHRTGDEVIAVVEIVSPANKSSKKHFRDFLAKATELLSHQIHLIIIDLLPTGPRDPQGIHAAIWEDMTGETYHLPQEKRFTLAAYEADLGIRAFVEHVAIGDALPEMPLSLKPRAHVELPLETTYCAAYNAVPRRWRRVLDETIDSPT